MNGRELPGSGVPPQEFTQLVKDALEHLYDFPYLQAHPLSRHEVNRSISTDRVTAQHLKSELLSAIEQLSPGPGVPFRAAHARLHTLLQLHYVEGLTICEAARMLGISERQAYRDLRRAEESVAAILWTQRCQEQTPGSAGAAELSSLQVEMARLEPKSSLCDLGALVRQAHKAVERLANARSISVRDRLPAQPVRITTDPVLALQVLTNLLSLAIRQALPDNLDVQLADASSPITLLIRYAPGHSSAPAFAANQVVVELVGRLGWRIACQDHQEGSRSIAVVTQAAGPTVLVIDDNEGLVELLERYLTGHACRVLAATSGQQGLELARQARPDAIVLDVMMPHMDGWELLQRLRTHPLTANIPVVVCSVFNDPELAFSLGASLFLPKPVRRADVLNALHQLGVV